MKYISVRSEVVLKKKSLLVWSLFIFQMFVAIFPLICRNMKPSHWSWSHCRCLERLCESNTGACAVCVHVLCLLTAGHYSTTGRKSFHCVTCCLGLCHLRSEKLLQCCCHNVCSQTQSPIWPVANNCNSSSGRTGRFAAKLQRVCFSSDLTGPKNCTFHWCCCF